MPERYVVPEFGLTIRYLPARVLRNCNLPEYAYGGVFTDSWSRFRPRSTAEWIAYLYERDNYEWVPTSKRPGDGDILLKHRDTLGLKEIEVKQNRDGLRTTQLRSLATRPSSDKNAREVVCMEEVDDYHKMDAVPCPRSQSHSRAAGSHCDYLKAARRINSLEVDSYLKGSTFFDGVIEKIHVQDCTQVPTLTVEVPETSQFCDVYDDVDALFPRCCYLFMGTSADLKKGIKLYTDRDRPLM
jgi:hypothetical protein